jgi:hypothetical protein
MDGKRASRLIVDLAVYLRGSLEFRNMDKMVTLDKEMELVDTYFRIEQARFGEKIQLVKELEISLDYQLPMLGSFPLQVLSVERTLLEKLVSLIGMSYELDMNELLRTTRHLYDIHCIYNAKMAKILYDPIEFSKLKSRVMSGEDQSRFGGKYPYTELWHNAPLFKDVLENESVANAYVNNFGAEFVFGELPFFPNIKETFNAIGEKLRMVE